MSLITQRVENPKRFEMIIDENMLWQMRQLAVDKKFGNTAQLVRAILRQYINSELKSK